MKNERLLFCYRGAITQAIMENAGETLKAHFELTHTQTARAMRTFSAFVELMQNIERYSPESAEPPVTLEGKNGIVAVGHTGKDYFLYSGNTVSQEKSTLLQEKLSPIKGMDAAELKAFYKTKRREGPDEHSLGAGLGFIELARNCQTFDFDLQAQDNETTFFSIRVLV
ncbi:MAG: hypothetical protein HQL52_04215 [Magnetococcales bacterium]|nr:hypothetical protein [Magnetococcales bacterium]